MNETGDDFLYADAAVNTLGLQASSVAWLMFAQTGLPGMYMLYSDLKEPHRERSILD